MSHTGRLQRPLRGVKSGGVALGVAALLMVACSSAVAAPSPPTEPTSGPGGLAYSWGAPSVVEHWNIFNDNESYWTYVPNNWQGSGPAPKTGPLVVFLHGFGAYTPSYYEEWLTHLAREGDVVVFPKYQSSIFTWPYNYTAYATSSLKTALTWLAENAAVKPDGTGMTLVSHSEGGVVAANIAEEYAGKKLPYPKALVLAAPANLGLDTSLSSIPANTLLDCVVGNADTVVGRSGCDPIWEGTSQVSRRNYLWMFSDNHGSPELVADHYVANNPGKPLAYYSYWKLADAATSCTTYGTECEYATGATSQEAFMGDWSDGQPVIPLSITTSKPACPTGSKAVGC